VEDVVLTGDPAPGGGTFSSFGAPQLNNQTQVAFHAGTMDGATAGSGIFIATKDPPALEAVATTATAWPTGGTFGSFNTSLALNASGQVAFRATRGGPAPQPTGLFVGTGGGGPAKVVMTGDVLPAGTVNSVPGSTWKLNVSGQVAFFSNLSTGQGVFLGSTGGAPVLVARNGDPAPGAGGATFGFFREESIGLNDSGQVAFWSGLNNAAPTPASIWQGWFLGAAGAAASPRLLHTQPLPGGGEVAVASPGARVAVLANSGEMAVYVGDVSHGAQPRVVIAGVDGALRQVATNGDNARGTGSDFGKLYPRLWATPSGRFLFSAMLLHGLTKAGVFVNAP
jgi:hypothetical protein